jgi:hypothetical protein
MKMCLLIFISTFLTACTMYIPPVDAPKAYIRIYDPVGFNTVAGLSIFQDPIEMTGLELITPLSKKIGYANHMEIYPIEANKLTTLALQLNQSGLVLTFFPRPNKLYYIVAFDPDMTTPFSAMLEKRGDRLYPVPSIYRRANGLDQYDETENKAKLRLNQIQL